MKRGFIILAALLGSMAITGTITAEETSVEKKELVEILNKGDGIIERTYSKYDESGNLIMKVSVKPDDSIFAYELFRYDNNAVYQLAYSKDGTLDSASCLVKDESGNTVEEFKQRPYVCSLKKYTYNEDNVLQSMVELNLDADGNVTGADHITEYTYENDHLTKETLFLILRDVKNELMSTEYIYEDNLLVQKQNAYTETKYTYDNGLLAAEQSSDEELQSSESNEYTYDTDGNLMKTIYHYETPDINMVYETDFIYDAYSDTTPEIEFPDYEISDDNIKAIQEKMELLESVELVTPTAVEEKADVNSEDIEPIDADKDLLQKVQEKLNEAGFDCGKADGLMGSRTAAAINNYQARNGLTVTGKINRELLNHMGL